MALRMGFGNVTHRSQGLRLCCWKTSLEMLNMWRWTNIYGMDSEMRQRTEHTAAVQEADRRNRGYAIATLAADYLLHRVEFTNSRKAAWERALGVSPILLNGRYGLARSGIGSHVILAIGLSDSDKVVYLDPFRRGWGRTNDYLYMTLEEAYTRLHINEHGFSDAWTCAARP